MEKIEYNVPEMGMTNSCYVTAVKDHNGKTYELSVLIDSPHRSFITFELIGESKLQEIGSSENYDKRQTAAIKKEVEDHIKFPEF